MSDELYKLNLIGHEILSIELIIANLSLRVRNLRKLTDGLSDDIRVRLKLDDMKTMGHLEDVARAERGEI